MQARLVVAVACIGLCVAGTVVSVSAHHAFSAEFDAKKPVNFTGKVTSMEWINPHVWIHVDVTLPDSAVESLGGRRRCAGQFVPPRLHEAIPAARHRDRG